MTPTPPAELLERAERLERFARSDDALEVLQGCERWPLPYNERGMILRATILSNRDPIAALDSLPETVDAFATAQGRFGYFSACSRAYIRARNLRAAEDLWEAARRELHGAEDPRRYEIALLAAWLQWNRRDYDPASRDIALAVQAPDSELRIKALNLRAWMYGGTEDYRALLDGLLDCLRLCKPYGERCSVRLVTETLQSAADLAWEMHDAEGARLSCQVFDAIPWTRDLGPERYVAVRALAWHAFLSGDAERAELLFSQARESASTPAWKAMTSVDAAHVAWLTGERARTQAALRSARDAADAVEWAATRNVESMALVTLGTLLARYDARAAQHYISVYHRLQPQSLLARMADAHESRRLRAFHKYADGQIAAVRGNRGLAVRLLSDAHDVFARIGFVFRAALAARVIFDLTGEEHWLAVARGYMGTNSVINLTPIT